MKNQEDIYWPNREDDKFLEIANKKIDDFYSYLDSSRIYDLYEMMLRLYHGGSNHQRSWFGGALDLKSTDKTRVYRNLKNNQFRSLCDSIVGLAGSEKTAFQCQAGSSDYDSQAQCILGNQLLDYYTRERELDSVFAESLRKAVIGLEAWISPTWSKSIGEVYTYDDNGKPIYEGDIEAKIYAIDEVIRDVNLKDHKQNQWFIVKELVNRHDLLAEYPDHAEAIKKASTERDTNKSRQLRPNEWQAQNDNHDLVTVYQFYHHRTAAVPQGKQILFVKGQVLQNIDLVYREVPLYRVTAGTISNTIFGNSPAADLAPLQAYLDIATSTVATTLGRKSSSAVWVSGEDEYTVDVEGDTKVFRSSQPPVPLDLSPIPQDAAAFSEQIVQAMQLASNVSSPTRGLAPTAGMSGAAMALLSANSISYHSQLTRAFDAAKSRVATAIIDHLKTFAKTERVVSLVSDSNQAYSHSFKPEEIAGISRVTVATTSPLAKTTSGKLQIADSLLNQGLITDPQQYITLLQTGSLDGLLEGSNAQTLAIKAENESLRRGEAVSAIVTEDHSRHIKAHQDVIASPAAKNNPELVKNVLAHIQEHLEMARGMDPQLAMILGHQPIPPAQPPMPPQGAAETMQPQGPGPIPAEGQELPSQPDLPIEPLSGEQFDPLK